MARPKSVFKTCAICKRKFVHDGREFCSDECVAANRHKRRGYFRARYLEKTYGVIPDERRRDPGRPRGTNAYLIRKVSREWRCSVDRAMEYIQRGNFPP